MINITADTLPWYLIGVLSSGLLAVFYAMLRGAIIPRRVAEQLRESAEKRAEIAEAAGAANTKTVQSLGDSVAKLMVFAENQDRVLKALRDRADQGHTQRRGGTS